jgi:hypothetical protein
MNVRPLALSLTLLCVSGTAWADPYDFRIYRLGNPFPGSTTFDSASDGNFRVFARQFAAAMTSVNLAPPETLGHAAFAVSAEVSVIGFGSQAVPLPTDAQFSGALILPSIHLRKGLPFSFEAGARIGWIEKSRMGTATLELKWALNEGFAYLPDIAVRGNITKLINSRDFDLTAGGLDLGIGKQFALGGMLTLTPYIGWNLVFVGASTGNIDFRPDRTLAQSERPSGRCDGPEDQRSSLCDIDTFESVNASQNSHNRFYGGIRFIGGALMLGAEFSYSVIGKFKDKTTGEDREVPSVMAFNGTVGLDF